LFYRRFYTDAEEIPKQTNPTGLKTVLCRTCFIRYKRRCGSECRSHESESTVWSVYALPRVWRFSVWHSPGRVLRKTAPTGPAKKWY